MKGDSKTQKSDITLSMQLGLNLLKYFFRRDSYRK